MNIEHIKSLSRQINIDLIPNSISPIPSGPGGGHQCWKIASDTESFFIKQLDPSLDLLDGEVIKRYELCESIALQFLHQGIPAIHAMNINNKFVTILDNTAYLIYPWLEGNKLTEISLNHACKIAGVLANIHAINLDVSELLPVFDLHSYEDIKSIIVNASCHKQTAAILKDNQSFIFEMNDKYLSAIPVLAEETVVTHGDVFPHNVLWQSSDKPYLIDWEAIKKWNPTREIIRASIAWSSLGSGNFSTTIYEAMLKQYIKSGGRFEKRHIQAALYGIYGSTINWLLHNIKIVCNSTDDAAIDIASNHIHQTILTSYKFDNIYSDLYDISKKVTLQLSSKS
jgi:hypothetical protein